MFNKSHLQPDEKSGRNYKGGKIIASGYFAIRKVDHPYNNGGYVLEHRLVMEYFLGRYLEPHEIVHHIDHNKQNNDIRNLQVLSMAEHRRLHNITDKTGVKKYNIEQVAFLYEAGYSMRDIAAELGIGKTTVGSYIKELGMSRDKNQNRCSITNQFIRRGQKAAMPERDERGKFIKKG